MNNPFKRKNTTPPEENSPDPNEKFTDFSWPEKIFDNKTTLPSEEEVKENENWELRNGAIKQMAEEAMGNPEVQPKVPLKEKVKNVFKEYIPNFSELKQKIKGFVEKSNTRPEENQTNELTDVIIGNQNLWFDSLNSFFEGDFSHKEPKAFPWTKDMSKKQFLKNAIIPGAAGLGAVAAKISARSALVKGSRAALAYASGGTGILIAGGAGAIAGSVFEGGKILIRERARTKTLESNLEQLGQDFDAWHAGYQERGAVDAVKEYVGMRSTLARAEKSAVSQEDIDKVNILKQKLEQVDLSSMLHKEKWMHENNKGKKLHKFLTVRSEQERDVLAQDPELRKIFSKLEKQRGSHAKIDKSKVLKAAGMGALIGGVTGLAGAAIAEAVHSVVYGGSSVHEAATTLTNHAKEATKAVTESPTGSSIKEAAKNLFADKKVTLHKGDTLWGLVKQWNLDHGVPADKLTNKMIMEQVKHTALKNGIDVVAWKDALDGTGMPDIKIPVGHEIVLDKGLADIGDHFGLHLTDHATDAAKEVLHAGNEVAQVGTHAINTVSGDTFSTVKKIGITLGVGLAASGAAGYLMREKIKDYFNKKKSQNNHPRKPLGISASPDVTSSPDNAPVENQDLGQLAQDKQVPPNGVEHFVNLLKEDGLLNQAEKNNLLDISDSQFIHDSLEAVHNYTSPNQEDVACLVDSIKTLRKHSGLEDIESTILAINPDLKDQIINEVEGSSINNASTPDNTQEKENDTEIEKLIEDWNEDKKDINLRIKDLENDVNDSDLSQLRGAIGNMFKSGEFYTSQRLPHYENPTPEQEKKVKQLELELEDQVKMWNTEISKIEQKVNTPSVSSWEQALSNEARSLNITEQDSINHYISLMDEKKGPVTKALHIGALNKAEVDELRKYIKAQQDYSDNPADINNIENVFRLLITKQSAAHGPGDKPEKLEEYKAIGKVLDVFQELNPSLLDKHMEELREEYMPLDQFTEYALVHWKKFPYWMKDIDAKRAWVKLSKKKGLLEEAVAKKVLTDSELKKIVGALQLPILNITKLPENIVNPMKKIRTKLVQKLGTSTTKEQVDFLNTLESELMLACPDLKFKNP